MNWVSKVANNNNSLFFILGPCAIENENHALETADFLKKLSEKLNFKLIYKSSFDKANRTSLKGYRSVGIDEGLQILAKVKQEFDLPIITDIHEAAQAERVAEVAVVLQIPAFLCRQTDLLLAAGKTGRVVNVKKGQFVSPQSMSHALDKVASSGNDKVWLCERGYAFGYNNLIVDYRNFPVMKATGAPVVYDATHSVQQPSGLGHASGGDRNLVPPLAAAAVVQGIAGVFMEVHEEPERAPCDGPNSVRLSDLERLISHLQKIDQLVKSDPIPQIK